MQGRKTAKGSKNRIEHRSHHIISSGVFVFVVAVLALGMEKGPTSRLGLAFPTHFGHFRIILILILIRVVR